MAFFDQTLLLSSAQAVTVTAASTNIYDVTGAGAGNAPALVHGTSAVFGADMGTGDGMARPAILFSIGQTFTAAGAATLQIQIQSAIDNGSNSPAAYTTLIETAALSLSSLVAGGMFNVVLPSLPPGVALPRFYRVNYIVATGPMTAGTITAALLLNPPTQVGVKYPENFTVA